MPAIVSSNVALPARLSRNDVNPAFSFSIPSRTLSRRVKFSRNPPTAAATSPIGLANARSAPPNRPVLIPAASSPSVAPRAVVRSLPTSPIAVRKPSLAPCPKARIDCAAPVNDRLMPCDMRWNMLSRGAWSATCFVAPAAFFCSFASRVASRAALPSALPKAVTPSAASPMASLCSAASFAALANA